MKMIDGLKWLGEHIPIKTVLDVGASNGCWSSECVKFYPESNYVLFEPQPVHNEALDLYSKKTNVTIIKKAVGDNIGVTFFDAAEPFGGALSEIDGSRMIQVPLTTIDCTIEELKIEGPYLIKLDTHGYERNILEGSFKTLKNTNALIIEVYNYEICKGSFLFWELCEYLSKRGFRPVYIVDILNREYDGSLWQMDVFFTRSEFDCFKYNAYK
jgi:FkbM family methyltransferase